MRIFYALIFVTLSLPVFVLGTNSAGAQVSQSLALPDPEVRRDMLLELARQVERIDGEGLPPRANRPETWEKTIANLANEAFAAKTLFDFGRVFKRLDATYPNLHAKVSLNPELDERVKAGSLRFPFKFSPTRVDRIYTNSSFRIVVEKNASTELKHGDELVSINSRAVQSWADENFIFCKFPLREQCETEFFDNFRKELLSWNRHQPLAIVIRRGDKELQFSVKPEIVLTPKEDEPAQWPCGISTKRYEGFSLKYEGENLCAFESNQDPRIVALRIKSFVYQDMPFAVLDGEVQIFWNNYWKRKSPYVRTLILDVIDNHGGQSPIAYYGLFFSRPYQEQYVQFKKIAEFEQPEIIKGLFWNEKGKEIWLENIRKDGTLASAAVGTFLGHIPQFCVGSKTDCREGLFEPRPHKFKGQVKLLMSPWCISSCVGFVSNMKDLLGKRVQTFGMPDSGDSAYARLAVHATPLPKGTVDIKIAPLKDATNPENHVPWVKQIVAASRSTDKDGQVISARPQKIDFWVPRAWHQTDEDWAATVFRKANGL